MKNRTKLRFLVAPIWILNMIFLFGSIQSIFSNDQNQLPTLVLVVVGIFFVFFTYLFYDITQFNRPKLIKIIAYILLGSAIYYIPVKNYIMILPALLTGILTLRFKFPVDETDFNEEKDK